MSAGLFTTCTPAFDSASIFSAAVPCPPAMIAPACPIRRPGGAVCPAMKPTTGFLNSVRMKAAASCSAVPPISPIMITASVSVSAANSVNASMNVVPMSGSPPTLSPTGSAVILVPRQVEIAAKAKPFGQRRDLSAAQTIGQRRNVGAAQVEAAADAEPVGQRRDLGAAQVEVAADAEPFGQRRDLGAAQVKAADLQGFRQG